ncbi:hypothetical protein GGS20DRAFT_556543 [Poronia punctata]|nr:hypothetical protein GGS20DRAFT_556543 [Poronia punctata]
MSKRTTFTTISPLPEGIPREAVIDFLHNHREMIDLNPLIIERHPIPPPAHAAEDERSLIWWSMTDKISYLPGGLVTGQIEYTAAFRNLPDGVQTHCYAPMGTDIRERWSLAGTLPGEPRQPVELGLGAPLEGLYLREDVELRCNFVMSGFVKKTLKKAHGDLVERLCRKAKAAAAAAAAAAVTANKTGNVYNLDENEKGGDDDGNSIQLSGKPGRPDSRNGNGNSNGYRHQQAPVELE